MRVKSVSSRLLNEYRPDARARAYGVINAASGGASSDEGVSSGRGHPERKGRRGGDSIGRGSRQWALNPHPLACNVEGRSGWVVRAD